MRRPVAATVAVAITCALVGCGASSTPATTIERTVRSTVTSTRVAPDPTFTPSPAAAVAPLSPDAAPPASHVEKPCPYIASSQDQGSVSIADLEGDRVYRTVVLTRLHPVGCRFYFWAPPFQAVADILPRTFATHRDAYNAMVLTARAGTNATAERGFAPGVDGIRYQTRFFADDGATDWAFVFAKGQVMVVVHTMQTNASQNAVSIASAIVDRF